MDTYVFLRRNKVSCHCFYVPLIISPDVLVVVFDNPVTEPLPDIALTGSDVVLDKNG